MPPFVAQMKPEVLQALGNLALFHPPKEPLPLSCLLIMFQPCWSVSIPGSDRIKFVPSQGFPTASHLAWNDPYLAPYGLLLNQF